MALFMDGPINDTANLQDYESSLLSMAAIEGVDITAKTVLAQDEIGRLLAAAPRYGVEIKPPPAKG